MRRYRQGVAVLACGLFAVCPPTVVAQSVVIAPQVFVADAGTRAVAITLYNSGDQPAEVSFGTLYGYPVTDSAGRMSLKTFEAVPDSMPSAAAWMQVFPKRLRIEPGAQQVVRLMASPPPDLVDREYWARLVVSAKGGRVQVQGTDSAGNKGISIGLDLEIRSILPVFYRNGKVSTGLVMQEPRATRVGDSLAVRIPLSRAGNAAFMGTLTATLTDSKRQPVAKGMLPVSVYYTLDPRVMIPIAGVEPGTYTLTVRIDPGREDLPDRWLIRGEGGDRVISVTIPPQ